MFAIQADNGWCGKVIEIEDVTNSSHPHANVLLEDAELPAPNWWSKTESYKLGLLRIRCWQRVEELDFKVGDVVSFNNIDIDGTDPVIVDGAKRYAQSGENGSRGNYQVVKRA
jgi:hypothetical protein